MATDPSILSLSGNVYSRTAIMAVVGGTTSVITGGKFANGAESGAFVHLYNAEYDTLGKALNGVWSKITDGTIGNDIKTAYNAHLKDIPQALEGGLNGYREVRDNAPVVPRYMLKGAMTAVELGLTSWIKDPLLYIYVNAGSGVYMDTIPYTNPVSAITNTVHSYSSHDSTWFK